MIHGLEYWYDGQQRRFLEQIVRAFSGFKYETGRRNGQDPQLVMVPCRLASTDRMVAHIIKNNSENTLNTVPLITVHQSGLKGRREDVQYQQHVDTIQIRERKIDPVTGKYLPELGRSYTVKRLMARPFEMDIQVDIWTSNMMQQHQLVEQILTVIYPEFDIQNSDNPLDQTALTIMHFESIDLNSRSIPVGSESEINVTTIRLRLPFWLSPPALVTEQRVIQQVITNINTGDSTGFSETTPLVTTPGNHWIDVDNGGIRLLGAKAQDDPTNPQDWGPLLERYGELRPTISTIRLKTEPENLDDDSFDIVGTIQIDANNPNRLLWQLDPDTLPANTLPSVNGVIDPLRSFPGSGLPGQVVGQRYLVINDVGNSQIWGNLSAKANDIIVYTQQGWVVATTPVVNGPSQYLLNVPTGRQLRWNGQEWVLTIDGTYAPGHWRIAL
jgi:hypothetical protein